MVYIPKMISPANLKPITYDGFIFRDKPRKENFWLTIRHGKSVPITAACAFHLGLKHGDKLVMAREGNKIYIKKAADGDITFEIHQGRYKISHGTQYVLKCTPNVMLTLRVALQLVYRKEEGKLYCEITDGTMLIDIDKQPKLTKKFTEPQYSHIVIEDEPNNIETNPDVEIDR